MNTDASASVDASVSANVGAEKIIECRNVSKCYDDGAARTQVLQSLNLDVAAGSALAIIGVSGSGKSTLLHLLGGLDTPDSGDILIDSEPIHQLSEKARSHFRNHRIGFIYQFHHLLGDFTVLENVVMPLLLRGERHSQVTADGIALLDKVGLKARAAHKPHQLSGGERQRVAICRALVTRPRLVLADEPTGQLDRASAERVTEELLHLNSEYNAALLFATHDEHLVRRLQTVYHLENGCLRNGQ